MTLTQLAAGLPVDVMPGEGDPASAALPQQPLHRFGPRHRVLCCHDQGSKPARPSAMRGLCLRPVSVSDGGTADISYRRILDALCGVYGCDAMPHAEPPMLTATVCATQVPVPRRIDLQDVQPRHQPARVCRGWHHLSGHQRPERGRRVEVRQLAYFDCPWLGRYMTDCCAHHRPYTLPDLRLTMLAAQQSKDWHILLCSRHIGRSIQIYKTLPQVLRC